MHLVEESNLYGTTSPFLPSLKAEMTCRRTMDRMVNFNAVQGCLKTADSRPNALQHLKVWIAFS
jgi:hypothetical protein